MQSGASRRDQRSQRVRRLTSPRRTADYLTLPSAQTVALVPGPCGRLPTAQSEEVPGIFTRFSIAADDFDITTRCHLPDAVR